MKRAKNPARLAAAGLGVIGVIVMAFLVSTTLRGPRSATRRDPIRDRKVLSPRSLERLMNPATRVAEATALGSTRTWEAAPILAQLSKEGDPEFRRACVKALGQIGDKESVHALRVRMYDEDTEVRIRCAGAFGKLYGFTAYQGLRDMLEDQEPVVRVAAANALADNLHDKLALRQLIGALSDSSVDVRTAAARGIARDDGEDAAFALIKALEDADQDIRLFAAAEIAKRRSPAAYEGLGWVLGHEDPAVRAAAGEAIVRIGAPIVPYLKRALTATPSLEARAGAVRLLGKVGGASAVPILVGMLDGIRGRSDVKMIKKLREAVVDGLTTIGEPGIPGMSEEVMVGERTVLAEQAVADVCVRIGSPAVKSIVEGITRWTFYHDPEELKMWLHALGEIGDPAALPALNRALSQDIDGLPELVAEVRKKIEDKSGKKLPDPKPDPVAFHAPIEKVAALDLDPGPLSPSTVATNRIPDEGVLWLCMWNCLKRDDSGVHMEVELVRHRGKWLPRMWARAPHYNSQHQHGRIVSETTTPESADLHVEFAIINDQHVPGGYAEYDIRLRAGDEGVTCDFKGHYSFQEVQGTASVDCRAGVAVGPDEAAVVSGEHPRMFFRKADLPVLRARARTDLGRRILRAIRRKVSDGKVEDYKKILNWTSNWTPGMTRAMGQSLFALLFDDPLHGRRAAQTAMLRCITPAYGGEHGELQAGPLQLLGYGHDMAYPYWTAEEREQARKLVAPMWMWIAPNSSVKHAGEGAFQFVGPPVLSLLREKGDLMLPKPRGAAKTIVLQPEETPPSRDGVPVNPLTPDKMVRNWLIMGPLPAGEDDPLAPVGGTAAAQPREGTEIDYKDLSAAFTPLPAEALQKTPGMPGKEERILLPVGGADRRTYLYSLVEVTKETMAILDCTHPLGHVGSRMWLNGRDVPNKSAVVLKPGLHRLMIQLWGTSVSPTFYGGSAARDRSQQLRSRVELELWEECRQHNERTGEMGDIRRYTRKMELSARRLMWYELDQTWRTGTFTGGSFGRTIPAYQRVMGVPLARDTPLPIRAFPALVWGQIGDEYLCYDIHLATPEIKQALRWEFDRRFLPDGALEKLPVDFLIAALVNYPMETEPRHPDDVLPRTMANEKKGGYIFRSSLRDGGLSTYIYAKASPRERVADSWAVAGFMQIRGFGMHWVTDGGWRRGPRKGHEVQNVVEVEGSEASGPGKALYYSPRGDGSGTIGIDMSGAYSEGADHPIRASRHLAIDYSGRSGAPGALALVDKIDGPGKKTWTLFSRESIKILSDREFVISEPAPEKGPPSNPATLRGHVISPADAKLRIRHLTTGKHGVVTTPFLEAVGSGDGNGFFVLMTLQRDAAPPCRVSGEGLDATVAVGKQTFRFDGKRIVFATE